VQLSVDFHEPTNASKDSRTSPEKTIMTARRRGLDCIVITGHNTQNGAIAAHSLDPSWLTLVRR
jgi:predicted metal-dependent phosphoesterase TrpH